MPSLPKNCTTDLELGGQCHYVVLLLLKHADNSVGRGQVCGK